MRVKTCTVRTHLTSSSCIVVPIVRCRHPSSSRVIIVNVSVRYTSTSHFVMRYYASSSLYLTVVRCWRHSSSDKADHCFLSKFLVLNCTSYLEQFTN